VSPPENGPAHQASGWAGPTLTLTNDRNTMEKQQVSARRIQEVGLGFWASKTLLSAVELDLFTLIGTSALTGAEIEQRAGLHPRATFDFLDALVALEFLHRTGAGGTARYSNSPETARYLDRRSADYSGGFLEMANARLYRFWDDLTQALRTGHPQNEVKHSGRPMFDELYSDAGRLEQFMGAMTGISKANFEAFANRFDFSDYGSVADIGGATGQLCCILARRHQHLRCTTFDLPAVQPIAQKYIEATGLKNRVTAEAMDFLTDDFPIVDVITMGMILHDWNLPNKKMLIAKAFNALPPGGAFVAIENLIDDERRRNAFGLLMSLNMLVEFGDAFDFSGADFRDWCLEAGFSRCEVMPLTEAASAAIAYKS
jgi:hypothetical protein